MAASIRLAETDQAIVRTFPVMRQLRPHLDESDYLPLIRRMMADGFRLAVLEDQGEVRAVAGYRFVEMLHRGRSIYVDDLVTDERFRSHGYGDLLFDWIVGECRRMRCGQLHLDSGTQRTAAHRFYLRKRMEITSFHFAMAIEPE